MDERRVRGASNRRPAAESDFYGLMMRPDFPRVRGRLGDVRMVDADSFHSSETELRIRCNVLRLRI